MGFHDFAWRTMQGQQPLLLHIIARAAPSGDGPLPVDAAEPEQGSGSGDSRLTAAGRTPAGPAPIAEAYVYKTDTILQLRKALNVGAKFAHLRIEAPDGQSLANHLTMADAGLRHRSEVHIAEINQLALASGSADCDLRIWDAEAGQVLDVLKAHKGPIRRVVFSPSGECLATASEDCSAKLWGVANRSCLATLEDHTEWVMGVSFSPDGATVATASMDCSAKLWDVETAKCVRTLKADLCPLFSAAFSMAGSTVVLAASPTATSAQIWDIRSGAIAQVVSPAEEKHAHVDNLIEACFSPDGRAVLTGSQDKTAKIWDLRSGACLQSFEGHTDTVSAASFGLDGKQVLTGSSDRSIRIWDAESGECVRTCTGHSGSVNAATFAPDGLSVASASRDATVRLWDAKSGKCLQTLHGHKSKVHTVSFLPF